MWMKSLAKLVVVLLVLAGGVYLFLHASKPDEKAEKKDNPPVPVVVAKAELRDLTIAVDLVGRGEAY